MILGTEGIVIGFFTAFSFPCHEWVLYLVTGILTLAAAIFFSVNIPQKYKQYTYVAGVGVVLLFVLTNSTFIKQGFLDLLRGVTASFNLRYQSQVVLEEQMLDEGRLTLFFALLILVVILILAFASIVKIDLLPVFLIEFPIFMIVVLMGNHVNGVSLLLVVLHFVGCMAQEYVLKDRNERNHLDGAEEEKNKQCLHSVQKKSACISGLCVVVAACISLYVLMPLLPDRIAAVQKWGAALQSKVVGIAVEYLPVITGGKWNLRVQTVGGGVEEGGLGESAGYSLTNLDDLIVTSTIEPKETFYLKGYIGSVYEGDKWSELSEDKFDNAAIYWHTEDNPRIYIQNLPFLRQLYQESKAGMDTAMGIVTVQNVNAGDNYTFVPYCSYLNDYYEISQGDGSVRSQDRAADEISYFPVSTYIQTMNGRSESEEEEILDRAEAEYAAYVRQNYLTVPEGFEELQEQCQAENIRKDDVEKIIRYVTTFLVSNYEYNIEVPKLPKGKDFVQYFLYESKEGYSAHFASTAVLMFRMFGVPSRYVTGYAAPESIFSMNVDGKYTALLQSDNSHAWAEIYMEGIGWIPVETTPGNIGVLQNVYGVEAEEEESEKESEEKETQELYEEEEDEETLKEQLAYAKIRWYLGCVILSLFAIIFIFLIYRKGRYELKRHGYGRGETSNEKLLSLFCMVHEMLQIAGMPKEVRSTSPEFYQWLKKVLPGIPESQVQMVVNMALASAYGEKEMSDKEVWFMRGIYRKCRKAVKKKRMMISGKKA